MAVSCSDQGEPIGKHLEMRDEKLCITIMVVELTFIFGVNRYNYSFDFLSSSYLLTSIYRDIWQFNGGDRTPSNTGYTKALHSVSQPDSRGKYGYFCYPEVSVSDMFVMHCNIVQLPTSMF